MDKKKKMLQRLDDYIANTPPEQLEKDWAELEKYNQEGPNIEDCLNLGEAHCKQSMDADAKSKDLCQKCEHFWHDFPMPLERVYCRCEELDKRMKYEDLDDVVPYPCLKCPCNSFLPKKDEK